MDTDHFFQVVGDKSLVFSRQLNISQHFWEKYSFQSSAHICS